jgi:hypothetical protein
VIRIERQKVDRNCSLKSEGAIDRHWPKAIVPDFEGNVRCEARQTVRH